MQPRLALPPFLASLILATTAPSSHAQDLSDIVGKTPKREFDTAVGLAASRGPEYVGSDRQSSSIRPYWAFHYGRWRISTAWAGQVLGLATGERGTGATGDIYEDKGWTVRLGLRHDRGRERGDSRYLADIADVPGTLRAKLSVVRDIAGPWSLHANYSSDLLNRGGGMELTLEGVRRQRVGPLTEWNVTVGATIADATLMRTQFGLSPTDAAKIGLPAHHPSAGFKDLHASVTWLHGLSRHWIVHASANTGLLVGGAGSSPLTHRSHWRGVSAGLGYRWGPDN